MKRLAGKFTFGIAAALFCILLSGCVYQVPITASPTRKIDEKLLGYWISKDGQDNITVRKWDDSTYLVSYMGNQLRGFHSDIGGMPFISLQYIGFAERRYLYLTWKLSKYGHRLDVRFVSEKVIPRTIKDSAELQRLLKDNLHNPELFGPELQYTKSP